jgi:nucleoside-diphosphate-sugar epimerase
MKSVLLTGATGFIGQHCLAPLLERGYEVHAVSSNPGKSPSTPGIIWHQANLLERGSGEALVAEIKPTHLLHLAWYVEPGKLIASPLNYAWVVASLELFRAFVAQKGERAVCSGSGYEYDWDYGYCSERLTPTAPNTAYGACKHALHAMAQEIVRGTATSLAWGRIFFLYGPRENPQRLAPSVILSLLRREPARCSHGRQIRDYMHVQDVADGLVALLDSKVEGAVNVSSGAATTIRELVLTIGSILGRSELLQLGAIPARSNDAPLVIGVNARLVGETGWNPKFDLESGLRQTIAWWTEELARNQNRTS